MAGKISELPAAGALGAADALEVLQGGQNRRATIGGVLSDLPLARGLPVETAAADAGRGATRRALLRGLDALARDGAAAWGPVGEFTPAAGVLAAAGEYRRVSARVLELGAADAAGAGVLQQATAIRLIGAGDHRVAAVAHGRGLALRAAVAPSGAGGAITARQVSASSVTRFTAAGAAGLAAGSIVSLAGVDQGGQAIGPDERFRVVAADAASFSVVHPRGGMGVPAGNASWIGWTPSDDAPERNLEIVAVATAAAVAGVRFLTVTTAGAHGLSPGNVVRLLDVDHVAAAAWWPVYSVPSLTSITIVQQTGGSAPAVGDAHATRVTVHLASDLPPALPNPLQVATPDVLVSLRRVQAEAARIGALQGQAAVRGSSALTRSPRIVSLWRSATSIQAAGTPPASWTWGDAGWTDGASPPGSTPWATSPAAVVVAGGEILVSALAEAIPGSPWTLGPWRVLSSTDAVWGVSSTGPWHAARQPADRYGRWRNPATGALGAAVPLYPHTADEWITLVGDHQLYESTNGADEVVNLAAPWYLYGAREISIEVRLRNLANTADAGRYNWIGEPIMDAAPHGTTGVPAGIGQLWSIVLSSTASEGPRFAVRDLGLPGLVNRDDLWGVVAKFRRGAADPPGYASHLDIHWRAVRRQFGHLYLRAR